MGAEPAQTGTSRAHLRWWHRGPFVRREVRLSVGTLLVFLFVFYVALPLAASHRAEVNTLAHINIAYLVLGVFLEIAALAAYTQLTHAVLPAGGPRRLRLFRINLSTLALSHVSPGGNAPGAALGYRLLTQSGVAGSDAGFALGTQGIGSAVVLNVIFWMSLVAFLVTHGFHVPAGRGGQESGSILVIVAAGVGVVLLGAFGGLFYLLTRGQERASLVIRRIAGRIRFLDADRTTALVERLAARFAAMMQDRALTRKAVGWAAANWLLDAASLWVFVAAFSHFISPVDLLMAYGLANILAAIPITPGGLGVVEFVLVSMITGFGPTAGGALSGVLAYRAVNFWLPIPFGGLAYASIEFEKRSTYRRVRSYLRDRMADARRRRPGAAPGGAGAPRAGGADGHLRDAARRSLPAISGVTAVAGVTGVSGVSDDRGTMTAATGAASTSSRARAPSTSPARPPIPVPEAPRSPAPLGQNPVPVGPTVRPGSYRSGADGIPEPVFGSDPGG